MPIGQSYEKIFLVEVSNRVSWDALAMLSVHTLHTCASIPASNTGEWPLMAFSGDVVFLLTFRDLFPYSPCLIGGGVDRI